MSWGNFQNANEAKLWQGKCFPLQLHLVDSCICLSFGFLSTTKGWSVDSLLLQLGRDAQDLLKIIWVAEQMDSIIVAAVRLKLYHKALLPTWRVQQSGTKNNFIILHDKVIGYRLYVFFFF